jgi:type II secretory pathway pseudopilin PulG
MAHDLEPRRRRRGREDGGFTVVEVMVAALLLAVTAIAVFGLVDAATRNNYRAEQSQVVNDRLQREMEQVKQVPYDQLALTSLPTHSNAANDPNSRVSGTTFDVDEGAGSDYQPLVYNGGNSQESGGAVSGGVVDPGPTPFQSGDVKGEVYRYVTWEHDAACSNCGQDWFKHVVIAVALDPTASGGTRTYQEVQGKLSNPNAGLSKCPAGSSGCTNPGGPDPTPWTFWLTDTPCSSSARQPIAGDHLSHDALGQCSAGLKTGPPGSGGANAGAADLMFTQAAPCTNSGCNPQDPLYDYATDVEPQQNADLDKGLQLTPPSANGCLLSTGNQPAPLNNLLELPSSEANPQLKAHKWLSPQIPSGFTDVTLDGDGELDLWTQTINGGVYGGKICVWLYVQTASGSDAATSNLDVTGNPSYFTYSKSTWPNNGWAEIQVPLRFSAVTLSAGSRLGLAITLEKQGTPSSSGLQFVYDHPSFDSRLEVDTHSLVPIF